MAGGGESITESGVCGESCGAVEASLVLSPVPSMCGEQLVQLERVPRSDDAGRRDPGLGL